MYTKPYSYYSCIENSATFSTPYLGPVETTARTVVSFAEAETLGASERIFGLQVVSAVDALVTGGSLHSRLAIAFGGVLRQNKGQEISIT